MAGPGYGSGNTFARCTPTGKLDTRFSGDGILTLDMGPNFSISDVAVQPDGKVVAVGTADSGFMVMRLLSNGALDGSFGSGGIVETNFGAAVATGAAGDARRRKDSSGRLVGRRSANVTRRRPYPTGTLMRLPRGGEG